MKTGHRNVPRVEPCAPNLLAMSVTAALRGGGFYIPRMLTSKCQTQGRPHWNSRIYVSGKGECFANSLPLAYLRPLWQERA